MSLEIDLKMIILIPFTIVFFLLIMVFARPLAEGQIIDEYTLSDNYVYPVNRTSIKVALDLEFNLNLKKENNEPEDNGTNVNTNSSSTSWESVGTERVTKEVSIAVNGLNKRLRGLLKNQGQSLVDAAVKNNLDPALFGAVVCQETGNGSAVNSKYNVAGIMGNGPLAKFKSLQEGVDYAAYNLKYQIDKNKAKSLEELGEIYCPVNDPRDVTGSNKKWVPNIRTILGEILNQGGQTD